MLICVSLNHLVFQGFNWFVKFNLKQNPGHRVSSLFLRCGHYSVPKFEPLVLTDNCGNLLAEGLNYFKEFKNFLKKNELLGQ